MRVLVYFRVVVLVVAAAGCIRTVDGFLTCTEVSVPCNCSNGLHGVQSCSHGQTTGVCVCTQPVAPSISITGNPAALSSNATYTATVNAVSGLVYDWSISGGTATSGSRGNTLTFIAGPPGGVLLTVDTSNDGGDTAPPQVFVITIVAPPASQASADFDVANPLTEERAGIPLRVRSPVSGLSYHWSVEGNAVVEPSGTLAHLTTGAPGTITVHVFATNSIGAASNTLDFPLTVVARQVENLAGVVGANGADGQGANASFGGNGSVSMSLVATGTGVYVGDYQNDTIRWVTASGEVTTIAGSVGNSGGSSPQDGVGAEAIVSLPVIALIPGATPSLLVGEDASGGGCPLAVASGLGNPEGATIVSLANCSTLLGAGNGNFSSVAALLVSGTPPQIYASDGSSVYTLALDNATTVTEVGGGSAAFQQVGALAADGQNLFVADQTGIWQVPLAGLASFNGQAANLAPIAGSTNPATLFGMLLSGSKFYLTLGSTASAGGGVFVTANPLNPSTTSNTLLLAGDENASPSLTPIDGAGLQSGPARFVNAQSLALSPNANTLYVADAYEVRAVSLTGVPQVATLAGSDTVDTDGPVSGTQARFASLTSLTVGTDDTVYLVDSPIESVLGFGNQPQTHAPNDICKIKTLSASGVEQTLTGGACFAPFINGTLQAASQGLPWGITIAADGTLFFAEWEYEEVREIAAQGLVLAGAGNEAPGATGFTPVKPVDGFAQTAVLAGPGTMAAAADGSIVVADYFVPPTSGNGTRATPTPYGLVRLLIDNQMVTVSPPCQTATSAGYTPEGVGDVAPGACMGQIGGLAIDSASGIYALAETELTNQDLAPGIFYLAPPLYSLNLLTFDAVDNDGHGNPCVPAQTESCATACMRIPPLLQPDAGGTANSMLVAGAVTDPLSGDLFFTDQELLRRLHRSATDCTITIVAGLAGQAATVAGPLLSAQFHNLTGLAMSPRTLDLYATDMTDNVVLRIRY